MAMQQYISDTIWNISESSSNSRQYASLDNISSLVSTSLNNLTNYVNAQLQGVATNLSHASDNNTEEVTVTESEASSIHNSGHQSLTRSVTPFTSTPTLNALKSLRLNHDPSDLSSQQSSQHLSLMILTNNINSSRLSQSLRVKRRLTRSLSDSSHTNTIMTSFWGPASHERDAMNRVKSMLGRLQAGVVSAVVKYMCKSGGELINCKTNKWGDAVERCEAYCGLLDMLWLRRDYSENCFFRNKEIFPWTATRGPRFGTDFPYRQVRRQVCCSTYTKFVSRCWDIDSWRVAIS